MKVGIIVQARMGSTRLPGKVLLPVAGKPMLAHLVDRLRQVRKADQIVIATSLNHGDDVIVEFCRDYGVAVFRGSELDVLSRYGAAAAECNADVVVRITGDCPLIDPGVIDEVISSYFDSAGSRCYVSNTLERTYPRGMDVEVFSRSLLDLTNITAVSPYDREHVTPFMIRNERNDIVQRNVAYGRNLSAYRFTLDYPKDGAQLSRLIESGLPDYSLRTLLDRAAKLGLDWHDNAEGQEQGQGQGQRRGQGQNILSQFGLGTAQFGMFYGKFNRDGVPSRETVRAILNKASELGLGAIDTARQYGESEFVLGYCRDELEKFDVITKTPHFAGDRVTAADARRLRESFDLSLRLMGLQSVGGLLVHNAPNLLLPGGERLWEELLRFKSEGRVRRIGISAYTGEIAEQIVERFPVDLVQLPINVFDRRLLDSGTLSRLHRRGVEIHARSAFLQGLLLADPATLSSRFDGVRATLEAFHVAARDAGVSPAHAALHYLLGIPEISRVIVGVESMVQLSDLFEHFPNQLDMDFSEFGIDHVEILNPASWVA